MAWTIEEFGKQFHADLASLSGGIAKMRSDKEKLEGEIRNLTSDKAHLPMALKITLRR